MLAVSQRGAWHDWILFFLQGVAEQSRDALERAQKLLNLRDQYRAKMQSAQAPGSALLLLDSLFELPALTVPLAASRLKQTYPGAKRNVQKLIELGVLTEAPHTPYPKLFIAPEILALVSAF